MSVRNSVLFFSCILSFAFGSLGAKACKLEASDRENARLAIDDVCGDTWCEGDYDYVFSSVNCDKNDTVKVDFVMSESADGGREVKKDKKYTATVGADLKGAHKVSCTINNIKTAEDVVGSSGLNEKFYDSLTDCINTLEGALSRK